MACILQGAQTGNTRAKGRVAGQVHPPLNTGHSPLSHGGIPGVKRGRISQGVYQSVNNLYNTAQYSKMYPIQQDVSYRAYLTEGTWWLPHRPLGRNSGVQSATAVVTPIGERASERVSEGVSVSQRICLTTPSKLSVDP
jgi:hypothetical protein